MALTACMQCLKSCGYLCGLLAALNIWFWLGMTIFNAMGNPWINMEILKEDFAADTSRFTTVFAIVLIVSTSLSSSKLIWSFKRVQLNVLCMIGCCFCTTMDCYADKDAIVYYTKGSNNRSLSSSRLNGSDYEKRYGHTD